MEDLDFLREHVEDILNNMGSHKYPRHTNLIPLSFSGSAVMCIPRRKFHIHLQEFFVGTAICQSSWDETCDSRCMVIRAYSISRSHNENLITLIRCLDFFDFKSFELEHFLNFLVVRKVLAKNYGKV